MGGGSSAKSLLNRSTRLSIGRRIPLVRVLIQGASDEPADIDESRRDDDGVWWSVVCRGVNDKGQLSADAELAAIYCSPLGWKLRLIRPPLLLVRQRWEENARSLFEGVRTSHGGRSLVPLSLSHVLRTVRGKEY